MLSRHTTHRRGPSGFTLAEILVALTIVAVLAGASYAIFLRSRESSGRDICQTNLRQISLAMQQYVHDNAGRYPLKRYRASRPPSPRKFINWRQAIVPYIKDKSVFLCPTTKAIQNTHAPLIRDLDGRRIPPRTNSYIYNAPGITLLLTKAKDRPGPAPIAVGTIARPDTTVLNYERPWWVELLPDGRRVLVSPADQAYSRSITVAPASLHSGGANYAFADGHVQWLTPDQVTQLYRSHQIR